MSDAVMREEPGVTRQWLARLMAFGAVALLFLKSVYVPLFLAPYGLRAPFGIESSLQANVALTAIAIALAGLLLWFGRSLAGVGRWAVIAAITVAVIMLSQDAAIYYQAYALEFLPR